MVISISYGGNLVVAGYTGCRLPREKNKRREWCMGQPKKARRLQRLECTNFLEMLKGFENMVLGIDSALAVRPALY